MANEPPVREQRCVACGYILFDVEFEPRCPECGLVNVPTELRRQVWELVDSRPWFYSGMFTPFRKRLPGWWWSLDREGDVRRSLRFALMHVLFAAMILTTGGFFFDSLIFHIYRQSTIRDQRGTEYVYQDWIFDVRLSGTRDPPVENALGPSFWTPSWTTVVQTSFEPSPWFLPISASMFAVVFGTWFCPAYIGLVTQIRKGLPSFARSRRTILSAANLESHRLIYTALMACAVLALIWAGVWLQLADRLKLTRIDAYFIPVVIGVIYSTCGWIGPLRSDFTGQLVRSRVHSIRIAIMYVAIFPWLIALLLIALGVAIWQFFLLLQ